MYIRQFLFLALITISSLSFGQQKTPWDSWTWLIGEWQGEGSGNPGQGSGTFSLYLDLDMHILVRKSHSEYLATETKLRVIHDDLMIIYPNYDGNPSKAIYFDNEGHVINYSITYEEKNITLVSDKQLNGYVFKLIYTMLDNNAMNTQFEMSQDGEVFVSYLEGKSIRVK